MEARGELEKAKEVAIDASESRQRIINAALQNMAVRSLVPRPPTWLGNEAGSTLIPWP